MEKLRDSRLDGILVSAPANVSYLCCYNIADSYLLISAKGAYFITDFRYANEAQRNISGFKIFQYKNLFKDIARIAGRLKIRRLGFEAKDLSFSEHSRIKVCLDEKVKLVDTFNLIESLRQVKTKDELKSIREAIRITGLTFKFLKRFLRPGMAELKIAAEIERFIRLRGAGRAAFDAIIAGGPNSCLPHARPSSRKIREGEPVLVDIGVDVNGYKSDLTRVFFLDKITGLQQRIYKIIQDAQAKAVEAVSAGVKISEVDRAARGYIEKSGYGKYFGHSLGHGVGLEVHEEPSISARNRLPLKEGMVFTVEPGIYLPGRFGMRLEDMVLVTKKGCEVLSGAVNKSI